MSEFGMRPTRPVTANFPQMRLAEIARSAYARPQAQGASGALEFGAGALGAVPFFGDVLGFANDVNQMRINPEQRTGMNMGLAAAGLLPIVPSGRLMAKSKKGAEGALQRTIRQDGNTFYDDAAGQYVEYVRFPSGKEGYQIGEVKELVPGKFIKNPIGDDWWSAPFKSFEDAWNGFSSAKKADALAANRAIYQQIPSHWRGNDRVAAKTLIDEFGPESVKFISSARSSSKYIQTPHGKVRISDHSLPGHYEDLSALDISNSVDKKTLVDALRKFANPPEEL